MIYSCFLFVTHYHVKWNDLKLECGKNERNVYKVRVSQRFLYSDEMTNADIRNNIGTGSVCMTIGEAYASHLYRVYLYFLYSGAKASIKSTGMLYSNYVNVASLDSTMERKRQRISLLSDHKKLPCFRFCIVEIPVTLLTGLLCV